MHPRLYIKEDLHEGKQVTLTEVQGHYLIHVLRLKNQGKLFLFNERGEFESEIYLPHKKEVKALVKTQVRFLEPELETTLLFAPIKKTRQEWLIEKATELGVSEFWPILTKHTTAFLSREDRLQAQIIEAVEQSERLSLPLLQSIQSLKEALKKWPSTLPLLVAAERQDTALLPKCVENIDLSQGVGLLIGPEGGFAAEEFLLLKNYPFIHFFSFGREILRAETAAIAGLAYLKLIRS